MLHIRKKTAAEYKQPDRFNGYLNTTAACSTVPLEWTANFRHGSRIVKAAGWQRGRVRV